MSAVKSAGIVKIAPEFIAEAECHAADTILQCYWREIASPHGLVTWLTSKNQNCRGGRFPHVARIEFPYVGRVVIAKLDRQSPVGIRHIGEIAFETDHGLNPVSRSELARLVVEEIALRHNRQVNEDLLVQMGLSAQVTAWILSTMPATILNFTKPSEAYLKSEQSLAYGHPFHPTPKARSGIAPDDLVLYSPESEARFQLHYFAVQKELLRQDSCVNRNATDLIAEDGPGHLLPNDGWALLPVHPWQAQYLLRFDGVLSAIKDRQIIDLGAHGKFFGPTASVRTMYSTDSAYFYKLSLSFRITNCLRRNALPELAASLRVNRMMTKIRPVMRDQFPQFDYLDEIAYLTLDLPSAPAIEQKAITEGFGLMLRRSLDTSTGTVPLLAASLFGNSGRGRRMLRQLLSLAGLGNEPSDESVASWFRRYVEVLLPPLLYLYSHFGIMFEPHLQNIVVGFSHGWPKIALLRDFENARLVAERIGRQFTDDLTAAEKAELYYSEIKAWKRFAYCLFSNHLVEAVRQLSFDRPMLESKLWQGVEDTIADYLVKYGESAASPMLRELLEGEPLPAKTNLLTRVLVGKDADAGYVSIGSPWANSGTAKTEGLRASDVSISINSVNGL